MLFKLTKIIQALLLPPASMLILIIAGIVVIRRHRTAGRALVAAGIALLYILSLEPVSDRLIRPLEAAYPPLNSKGIKADAVVVLGDGVRDLSWIPAGPEPSPASLQRLVEGIRIAGSLRIPLVVSGGSGALAPTEAREADAMAALAVKLGFPRGNLVIEDRSRNTWENAEQVKGLVSGRTIILVTSAYHLKRAAGMFRKQGFTVIPAPAAYESGSRPLSITVLLPRAGALDISSTALAEYLSIIWYWSSGKL
jgi:uncharacterized SAM-binding protein YcdF (DUF218 family)